MPKNNRPRTTTTQSVSFNNDVYDVLEQQRGGAKLGGLAMPRSEYLQETLIMRWEREGVWPPKKAKGGRG
jgi:hypothetical protein